ncbi:hypothetical protein NQZ79_g7945 [Umbelopsis isabellina]|nr:hypothetical protein NQZ79_g7945 [Umbelopsis isabellina]
MYSLNDAQAQARQQKIDLDVELSKYKVFRDLEAQTKINKVYIFLGGLGLLLVLIVFNIAGELVTDAIAWIYPVIASFQAIDSPSPAANRQWLTYWSIFGAVKMLEYFLNALLYWIPYWFVIKTVFFLWLSLPQFTGAEVIYNQYKQRVSNGNGPKIDTFKAKVSQITAKNKDILSPKSPKSQKSL